MIKLRWKWAALLFLTNFSVIPMCLGSIQTSRKISSYGVISEVTPTPTIITYYENKVNSFADIDAPNQNRVTWEPWNGLSWLENSRYVIELTDEISPHSPPYSCKTSIFPEDGDNWSRRCNFRINYDPNIKEYWAYTWLYYPSPPFPINYCGTIAWKEIGNDGAGPVCKWLVQTKPSGLHVRGHHIGPEDKNYGWDLDKQIPFNQWFRMAVHVIRDKTNGSIEFYLNNEKIFGKTGTQTNWYDPDDPTVLWFYTASCHYTPDTAPPSTTYFDDIMITNSWIPV